MADRIAVMHEGVLQQLGTPGDIYNHPENEFVAGFVGEPPMNLLDCTLEGTDAVPAVTHPGFRLPLSDRQAERLSACRAGMPVRVGIRPDDLRIEPGADGTLDVPGEVFVTEPLGGDMVVEANVGGDRITVKTKIGPMGGPGEPCRLAFDTDKLHVFDKDSGAAFF